MKNKSTKNKSKKRGSENAFGCDLIEHLQNSGQDVPQVLIKCAEFIEEHGIVDGIYRLSGVTSNIQRLRQEFSSEACPDLTKEVYLQDIHCVGSLCKLYFRELPNPLLTYELYSKFTEVVKVQGDHERLLYIQRVVRELPTPHMRTLEYLTKHLAHLATLSAQTNMHTRNLALVWAPNLLRSKDIEESSGNGDMAFQAVRIQQSVVEFILNHTEQIFSSESVQIKPREGLTLKCGEKYATLPISGQCGPMKLMSLEEAQARSLSPNHPVHKERQRENSLPDTSTAALYHTVIDISDSKRKFSGKSKKWRSIFNLGRSMDSKGKLSRNGSVFIRAPGLTEKTALRPSRSMESLCSLPTDDDRTGSSPSSGIYVPDVKSRTLGSDSLYDLSEHDQNAGFKGNKAGGATGGWSTSPNQKASPGASAPPQKTLPEQLKVYKSDELTGYKPTSPKNRRMLYSGSSNSSSRPSFPGSFFPLESSPRHQRRAVNISEPFAVSVPLRVSAVISSNSMPCRGHAKDKAATLKPCKETSEQSSGKSNTFHQVEANKEEGTEKKNTEEPTARVLPEDAIKEVVQKPQREMDTSELESSCYTLTTENDLAQSPGEQLHNRTIAPQTGKRSSTVTELWSDLHQELKIVEPEFDLLHETFEPVFSSKSTCKVKNLTMDINSKWSRSSPSLSLLFSEQSSNTSLSNHRIATGSTSAKKQPSESDISFFLDKNREKSQPAAMKTEKEEMLHQKIKSLNKDDSFPSEQCQLPLGETCSEKEVMALTIEDPPVSDEIDKKTETHLIPPGETNGSSNGEKETMIPELEVIQRLSVCLEEKRNTLMLPHLDHEERCGCSSEDLDLVEPWEDLSFTKQWVTSPLHSPDVEELFNQLSPFHPCRETLSSEGTSEERKTSPPPVENIKPSLIKSTERISGNITQTKPKTNWTNVPSIMTRVTVNSNNGAQLHSGKSSTTKQKTTASSQGFHRQMSHDGTVSGRREENVFSKHRPYSLNLDMGHRYIRDISNQQNCNSSEFSSCLRGSLTTSGTPNNGFPSELDLFLSDRQAPLRRNSAPVSVSSVRTAFMIKTCQAKAVPVIPPRVQYSQIPHSRYDNDLDARDQEKVYPKMSAEKHDAAPPVIMSNLKEELENKEPAPKPPNAEKYMENVMTTSTPELPVITRRHTPTLDVFMDCPRLSRGNLLQKSSFRNRQRPQSLILLSPPFPIMDYPPPGDDGKLLSSIKSLNDTSVGNVFPKEMAENVRAPDVITLQNKMTIPKSGQRLETSTSCFYQPQRRSMIFDSRSHRQIE
ncbi:rho GTPase-activating protein 31 [Antennarius striatus]|uniref:rho GTPase-activating protein 31 n=1 Tax=Antennarius striatus TaxID=241820 RepID=UPI0035B45D4E